MASHRVLVVDDDDDHREVMISVLEDAGHVVVGAANGVEALARLAAAGPRPCLIFLDLMMPIMDGHEFRAEQLKDPGLAAIPVVVISAYRDVAERALALVLDHLAKPIRLADLKACVLRACLDPGAH